MVLIGEGDLSQDLGHPRQYDHPTVASAIADVVAICKQYNVPCGHPHVDVKNVESVCEGIPLVDGSAGNVLRGVGTGAPADRPLRR